MIPLRRPKLNRRTVLRGLASGGLVTLGLPTLDIMLNEHGTAHAGGKALPKRFVVWYFGNGLALENPNDGYGSDVLFAPSAPGPEYELTPQLQPLEAVKEYCSVLSSYEVGFNNGHHQGCCGILSGTPYIELGAPGENNSKFGGPSIDQLIADVIGQETALPSVQLAVSKALMTSEGPTLEFVSHKGPDQPLPQIFNPREAWSKLFASFSPPDVDDPSKPLRLRGLDAVREDALSLRKQLGQADRMRLDAHLEAVAQLEQQINTIAPACTSPDEPILDEEFFEVRSEVNALMADLMTVAFSCDITRVGSLQYSGETGSHSFDEIGISGGHHGITHDISRNDDHDATVIHTMAQFAYLLERLKDTPEGDGNLLDQSCVLLATGLASGWGHTIFPHSSIVAGGGGGALKHPGVHYRSPDRENTSDILLSCLQVFDPSATEVGKDGGRSTTPCGAILA